MAKNYYPEFCVDDATADVIIEKGRYWDDKTTFFSYKLTSGYDPNHYFSFDVNRGSESSGWTLFSTPGTFQVKAGKKTPEKSSAINLFADNGDISITCMNGDIRLKARNIHIDSGLNVRNSVDGVVNIAGHQKVSIHAPTIDIEAKKMLRLISSGDGVLKISNVMEMYMGMCKAFSNSSSENPPVNGMSQNYTE
jgi:hypothetical protein